MHCTCYCVLKQIFSSISNNNSCISLEQKNSSNNDLKSLISFPPITLTWEMHSEIVAKETQNGSKYVRFRKFKHLNCLPRPAPNLSRFHACTSNFKILLPPSLTTKRTCRTTSFPSPRPRTVPRSRGTPWQSSGSVRCTARADRAL